MNARIRKRIHKIIDLSIDLKDFGHDCFIDTLPHVNQIKIYCYKDGFAIEKEEVLYEHIYLDDDETIEQLDKIIEFLEKLIDESV